MKNTRNLGSVQTWVLTILKNKKYIDRKDIEQCSGLFRMWRYPSDAYRTLKSLEKRGLIEKRDDKYRLVSEKSTKNTRGKKKCNPKRVRHVDGRVIWKLNCKLHREDGPAVEYANGSKAWYWNDKLHREDGPAVEWADGDKEWWINGKRHREDGPAIEYASGSKFWYFNGKLHREDGPAIEYANGSKEWWINGKLHREDGPAIEYANGSKEWWINGEYYTEAEFLKKTSSCEGKIIEVDGRKYRLSAI